MSLAAINLSDDVVSLKPLQSIIIQGLEYANNVSHAITKHTMQRDITTQRLSKNVLESMRASLSTPVIFAVLRIFRRIQKYLERCEVEYDATGSVTVFSPYTKNSVDFTVAYIVKQIAKQIDVSLKNTIRTQNPDYNPYRSLRMVIGSINHYIALKQFDIEL